MTSGAGVDASAGIRLGAFVQPLTTLPPKLKDDNCIICTFKVDEAGMYDDDNAYRKSDAHAYASTY